MTDQELSKTDFSLMQQTGGTAMLAAEAARSIQEVQASLVIAKQFPRDINTAVTKIMVACQRKKLAEDAMYMYPRGGTQVTGPSIRLAETLAQNWGNMDFGIRELSQQDGCSEVESFAWDKETNTRQTKTFRVPHIRYSKAKGNTELSDPRDIYEMIANQAARRLRSCILGIIPGDIVDKAVAQCEKTLEGASDEPIADRIQNMIIKFQEIGVDKGMLEAKLGHKIEVTVPAEIVNLQKIYKSINDNMADRSDFFDLPEVEQDEKTRELNELLIEKRKKNEARKAKEKADKSKSEKEPKSTESKKEPEPESEEGVGEQDTDYLKIDLDTQQQLTALAIKNKVDLEEALQNWGYDDIKAVLRTDADPIASWIKNNSNK